MILKENHEQTLFKEPSLFIQTNIYTMEGKGIREIAILLK